jgi:hypothetical protein
MLSKFRKGNFQKDPDGSVWIDLTDEGLDRKIVQVSRWYGCVYDARYWYGNSTCERHARCGMWYIL